METIEYIAKNTDKYPAIPAPGEIIVPKNSEDLVGLLERQIQTKDLQGAEKIADQLFSKDPYTLSEFGDIMGVYLKNGYSDELPKFFKRMESKFWKK